MERAQRDGSLLRRKQEQWAKEKEEEQIIKKDWFPFGVNGSPGGGNPNKKYEIKDYSNATASCDEGHISRRDTRRGDVHTRSNAKVDDNANENTPCPAELLLASMRESISCTVPCKADDSMQPTTAAPQYIYAPYAHPISAEYLQNFPPGQQQYFAYPPIPVPFHLIPPGAIPIPPPQPHPTSSCDATAGSQQTAASTYTEQWTQQHWNPDSQPGTYPYAYSVTSSTAESRPLNMAVVHPMYTGCTVQTAGSVNGDVQKASPHPQPTHNGGERPQSDSKHSEASFEEQVEERCRREREWELQERRDGERIEREREEKETQRRREEERQADEERRKEMDKERQQQQLLEALEKAKREAQLMKKAKIYKHVLEAPDVSPDVEKKLLGVDDADDGDRILKEVGQMINAFERHRQRELEDLKFARSPQKSGREEPSPFVRSQSMRARSSSTSAESREKEVPTRKVRPSTSVTPLNRNAAGRQSLNIGRRPKDTQPIVQRSSSVERKSVPSTPSSTTSSRIPVPAQRTRAMSITATSEYEVTEPSPIRDPMQISCPDSVETVRREQRAQTAAPSPPNRIFSRPPPGPWSTPSNKKLQDILLHSASIRQLPDKEAFTRPSTRSRQGSVDAQSLLFAYTPVRRGRMRVSTDCDGSVEPTDALRGSVESNDASSSGSVSPASHEHSQKSPSVPSISVQDSDSENRCLHAHNNNNNNDEKAHAIVNSPIAYMGRPRSAANKPVFHKRLGELGALKTVESNDALSPEQRRLAESRFPSMEKLRMSMNNLNMAGTGGGSRQDLRGSRHDLQERASSPLLASFRSRAPLYRSFNLKKNADKQTAVLERLGHLRDQLRTKDNFQEPTRFSPSHIGSTASLRLSHS